MIALLQMRVPIKTARILTAYRQSFRRSHCLLLATDVGDQIAIKSGFSAGGTGSHCFSMTLQLLDSHGAEIDEVEVEEEFLDRLDNAALTRGDLQRLEDARPVRPSAWPEYVKRYHFDQSRDGSLWKSIPEVLPFAIVEPRLMDLARAFWSDPDATLSRGYRRLEDAVRDRSGINESGSKLFSRAFLNEGATLTWNVADESEKQGRAQLFTGTFMAFRNPRQHREKSTANALAEFLLLNQLYLLEAEAILKAEVSDEG